MSKETGRADVSDPREEHLSSNHQKGDRLRTQEARKHSSHSSRLPKTLLQLMDSWKTQIWESRTIAQWLNRG